MVPTTIYNNIFFNHLFTAKELEFLNNMDSNIKEIDSIIKNEELNRDTIVYFINNLHDMVSKDNLNTETENFPKLLSDIQNIFELINENINLLHTHQQTFNNIKKYMADLLIKIETENDAKDTYFNEIFDFKNRINDFSDDVKNSKSKVALNDIKIDNFLQQSIVKNYLNSFSEETAISNEDSLKFDDTTSEHIAENNSTLLVSEALKRVYLPYSKKEVLEYLQQYPNQYTSFEDVIKQEFIFHLDFYLKHPITARFRESYTLIRDRESKSFWEAFKFAIDMMFRHDLNPTIIAACKTQEQLEHYLSCLERNSLEEFKDFEIRFELNPLS